MEKRMKKRTCLTVIAGMIMTAAPLIYEPFTNGQLGILMPKGSESLLEYVNAFLEEERESGRLDELADEYIYRYIEKELEPAA